MPTSSQSRILSTVDYHLQQQQSSIPSDGPTKPLVHPKSAHASLGDRRPLRAMKEEDEPSVTSPSTSNLMRRRSSVKTTTDAKLRKIRRDRRHHRCFSRHISFIFVPNSSRSAHRAHSLTVPVVNMNGYAPAESRLPMKSAENRRGSLRDDMAETVKTEYKLSEMKRYTTPRQSDGENSSLSDLEYVQNVENNDEKDDQRTSRLNETARRLLVLGTIRPSRTFYKDLPEGDVEYLMEYFRRMREKQRTMTSDEINAELTKKYVEYKPKVFFDSSCVTKNQVRNIEKFMEPYAGPIRDEKAELAKLENPLRFVIREKGTDAVLKAVPHDFNDCLLTLISHSDPLRKSELIAGLVSQQLLRDVKENALDISYFPGGVNYDVPREEIQEDGHMNLDTYKKIKQRLSHRKLWYFSGPPEKKVNAVVITLPVEYPSKITHEKLLDLLYDRLKSFPTDENIKIRQRILSIEYLPLSCIFSSFDVANQFVVDCDGNETKQHLLDKPLTVIIHKHSIALEIQSYDEYIQREYQKYLKAEKYRELIRNHDEAVKRSTAHK